MAASIPVGEPPVDDSTTPVVMPPSKILDWYEKISTRFVDLVSDYAGKETFLVEGDSLLLECFRDPRIDFDNGFQILHVVYVIEDFLTNLQRRGCQFHIVFFRHHEILVTPPYRAPSYKYNLARSVIIQHLLSQQARSESKVEINLFDSLVDVNFRNYVNESGAYFIACCDGASSNNSSVAATTEPHQTAEPGFEVQSLEPTNGNQRYLRGMIHNFMKLGLDIALINGLEWRDSKVMTFVLERKNGIGQEDGPIEQEFSLLRTQVIRNREFAIRQMDLKPYSSSDVQTFLDGFPKVEGVNPMSARLIVTMITLSELYSSIYGRLCAALILHTLLLDKLPMSLRRLSNIRFDHDGEELYEHFIKKFSVRSKTIIDHLDFTRYADSFDLADLVDGRLFRNVIASFNAPDILLAQLPEQVKIAFEALEKYLGNGNTPRDSVLKLVSASRLVDQKNAQPHEVEASVMPFSHPQFDRHLSSISITVKDPPSKNSSNGKLFRELTHWHNSKKPLVQGRGRSEIDKKKEARWQRSNQRFMAEMTAYAASLTNASGKILTPETIIAGKDSANIPPPQSLTKQPAKQAKGKQSGKALLQKKVALDQEKKDKERNEAALLAWKRFATDILEHVPDLRTRYNRAISYLDDKAGQKNIDVIVPEINLYKLKTLNQIWSSYCRTSNKEQGFHVAALILVITDQLAKSDLESPAETAAILKEMGKRIGFVIPPLDVLGRRPLTFPFAFERSAPLEIGIKSQDFSLLHVGPYFDRDMDSQEDSRVQFRPDGWQVKVLDLLDKKSSLLVVAPTSSGKTFISFYAMEKVLRANDDDIVVYVAPTKALVNQIAAEVQARFSKTYKYPGKSLYAIHTRDYRVNNPNQCQVLVTVPHILQIMLLSPSNAKTWCPRIKTIIFDEVHSIGQAEDGVVWEQLLMMAPCQVIALSATVGNPTAFTDWLQTTQNAISIDLQMVQHNTRFSDLRNFVYYPSKNPDFVQLAPKPSLTPLGLEGISGFHYLHPVASLTNEKRGMSDDLALESKDCLLLYQAMKTHETGRFKVPEDLSPPNAIPEFGIVKADILKWGAELRRVLKTWMKNPESPFRRVVEELGRDVSNAYTQDCEAQQQLSKDDEPIEQDYFNSEFSGLAVTALPMIAKLHESDALPAILFNYDRSGCEKIVDEILNQLVAAEKRWRSTDSTWRAKVAAFEEWKKFKESKQEQKRTGIEANDKKKKRTGDQDEGSKQDRARDKSNFEDHRFEGFDQDSPSLEFSFANEKVVDVDELRILIEKLRWRGISDKLIDAFRRGIGVHHAGMNRKYRQAVEIYFRKGYLRVVIATGTLSLGINMPCKTVVFSGDSVFLTALNFRQAAGRAGRRGFDLLGNVVFHGVSLHKAYRLLSSRLPDLNGHFPLTTTFVLRLLILLHESGNSKYAIQAVNSLLTQPRLYLGGESFRHQVLHHLRFSIEYLRTQRLISAKGEPTDFCSVISHLYFTENAAFSFHALLKEGYFSNLAASLATNETTTLRELMIVMANLFGRQSCRLVDKERARTGSVVFLPELPEKAAFILKNHNLSTLKTYQTYVSTYAEQHCKDDDRTLPFTGLKVAAPSSEGTPLPFLNTLPPTKARSSFYALSGHSDTFTSIFDLCSSVRSGIFLEKAVVPHLDTGEELKAPLNAYLFDFFNHGNKHALEVSNGIRRGDVWYLLNDFSLVLATIVASLENFLKPGDKELDLTSIGGSADDHELDVDSQEEALSSAGATSDTMSNGTTTSSAEGKKTDWVTTRKKMKVIDDWEDEAENGDEEAGGMEDVNNGMDGLDIEDGQADGRLWLLRVCLMFKKLKLEFDTKFRKIFA